MDKNEYKVRLEEIKQLIEQENYVEAASVADQIEWKKVRNVNTLCMISEVYEAVDRYEDSKVLLLREEILLRTLHNDRHQHDRNRKDDQGDQRHQRRY